MSSHLQCAVWRRRNIFLGDRNEALERTMNHYFHQTKCHIWKLYSQIEQRRKKKWTKCRIVFCLKFRLWSDICVCVCALFCIQQRFGYLWQKQFVCLATIITYYNASIHCVYVRHSGRIEQNKWHNDNVIKFRYVVVHYCSEQSPTSRPHNRYEKNMKNIYFVPSISNSIAQFDMS